MSDIQAGIAPELEKKIGGKIEILSRWLAWSGGFVLLLLTLMTCVSITGRSILTMFRESDFGPVPGDFELIQAGCAYVVFSFLPWCHFRRGHVTVDIFLMKVSPQGMAFLSLVGNTILTICTVILSVQMQKGLVGKMSYGETTMILQMPVWWAFYISFIGSCVFALVSFYSVWRSYNEMQNRGELIL
jgi:TRAP-type C4-dicarboxylate transport system permease small subunit